MGNLVKLLVLATVMGGLLVFTNMKGVSDALTDKHIDQSVNILARNTARAGHDMLLAQSYDLVSGRWKSNSPVSTGSPVPATDGRFWVTSYATSSLGDTLTFSIRGENLGAVHEITASYSWEQFISPSPWMLSGAPLDLTVDAGAKFNFGSDSAGVDISALELLNETLDSLDIVAPPGISGLTPEGLVQHVQDAFNASGHTIDAKAVTEQDKLNMGEFSPNVLLQGIESRIDDIRQTSLHKIIGPAGASNVNLNLNSGTTGHIVEVRGDATIDNLTGKGTLVINGDLSVPVGKTLDWEGLVIVKGEGLKTSVDLKGNVRIQGSLMTTHESGFSNIGHIDVSAWRDNSAWPWAQSKGSHFLSGANDPPLFKHTHRYDVNHGKFIQYNDLYRLGFRGLKNYFTNQGPVQLGLLRAQTAHGKSQFNFKLKGGPLYSGLVEHGFPEGLRASSADPYLTKPFSANDIETFNIYVQSKAHLQKSWDLAEGYGDHCGNAVKGPRCVSQDYNRNGALTVRVYEPGDGTTHYESSIYWHMLESEVSEYQDDLADYISSLSSGADSGLDIHIGSNAEISSDRSAVNATGIPEGIGGPNLLSINERHYNRLDAQNPCNTGTITDCSN